MQTCQQFATVALQLPKYFEISSGKLHETKNCDIEGHDLTTKRTVDRCLKFKIGTDISNKRSTWPGKKNRRKKIQRSILMNYYTWMIIAALVCLLKRSSLRAVNPRMPV